MLLPTTHLSVLLLLLLTVVCLGSWASTFKAVGKAAGPAWRFELFSFDFAFGAIAAAALLAFTAGRLGSELSFVDRIAVSGLQQQAMAIGSGFIFTIGNMLLLGSVSLLGMAAAFPLVAAVALIVWSLTYFHGVSYPLLALGDLFLIGSILAVVASRRGKAKAEPAPGVRPSTAPAPMKRRIKGIIAGLLGGLFIGASYPIAENGFWGDLGLGAYAGLLLFTVGVVISTLVFGIFLMNIAIDGPRLTPRAYFGGSAGAHVLGLLGGIVWTAGMSGWLLAQSAPAAEQPAYSTVLLAFQGAAIIALLWGVLVWREYHIRTARSKTLLGLTAILYLAGLAALSFRFR